MRKFSVAGFTMFFSLLLVSQAQAYVDPGSGSLIVTGIIGFFAAITYTLRKTLYRVKDAIFGRKKPASDDNQAAE